MGASPPGRFPSNSPSMKAVAVFNPAAGAYRAANRWRKLKPLLEKRLGRIDELPTRHPGHASELTEQALHAGAERIFSVGGDGTWHEVVAGYLATPKENRQALLGFCPAGSGCDFARHMRLPTGSGLADMLCGDRVRKIDALRAQVSTDDGPQTTYLTNLAAFGLGGDVAALVARTGKPLGGTASYLLATLAVLLRSRARRYRLRLDDQEIEQRAHAVILANTSTTGGGMLIAPEANAEDGRFEVITFADMSRLALLRRFPKIYSGDHLQEPGITLRQARRLEVLALDRDRDAPLNIDGELYGKLPAVFEILPGILPVLA
jgi:diacylglycerol kinase (ATP)